MDRTEKVSLTQRLLSHIDNNTTDYADSVLVVPFAAFGDPELHLKEVAAVRQAPHVVAHVSELPKAGDFITTDLMGTSIIVVRQGDGSVKALSNTCRHRGAKVEFEASGCRRIFTCPYHSWAYGREGDLQALPHEGDFDGMDKGEFGLLEYPCEVRYGLVWVVPTVDGHIDVAGLIGEKHDKELQDTGISSSWQHRGGRGAR